MDFLWALAFWAWYELLSLPVRFLLASTPAPADVRRLLSRLAGPALLTLPVWFAAHGIAGVASPPVAHALLLLALVLSALVSTRSGQSLARMASWDLAGPAGQTIPWWRHLTLEVVSLALFLAFVAFRRWVPEMTCDVGASAAEKFMNMMMFWANWTASSLPAQDLWLCGNPVNYYDWGHFHWVWVSRSAGFSAPVAINLALARVTLQVWEGAYLLARSVRLGSVWSGGAATMVAWAGNPAAWLPAWSVWSTTVEVGRPFDWSAYDFWAPSRAIANVVDEFPAFSAILGDFHAHHLALGWFTGWLSVLVAEHRWGSGAGRGAGAVCATCSATLGAAAVLTNLWNLPTAGWGLALAVLAAAVASRLDGVVASLKRACPFVALLAVGLVVQWGHARIPVAQTVTDSSFWSRLPIRPVPATLRTVPTELLAMWGVPVGLLALAAVRRAVVSPGRWTPAILVAALGLILVSGGAGFSPPGGVAWAWAGVALLVAALGRELPSRAPAPLLWLGAGACCVLAGLELVYVQDRFTGELVRYNTYFKFCYPVWPVLTIVGAAALERTLRRAPATTGAAGTLLCGIRAVGLALAAAAMVYPALAIPARLGQAARGDLEPRRPGLDAVGFVANRSPFSVEAPMLGWIRDHVPPGDVVAEAAVSGAYHYTGRVASLAGRPVPLGWDHHEHQWRGPASYEMVARRAQQVDSLYRATTRPAVLAAAAELGARWVLFGLAEADRYGPLALDNLRRCAPVAVEFTSRRPDRPSVTITLFDLRRAGQPGTNR